MTESYTFLYDEFKKWILYVFLYYGSFLNSIFFFSILYKHQNLFNLVS